MADTKQGDRLISKNRRAHFDFDLGERYEAGMVLEGSEVRSLRDNPADLSGAWVQIDRNGEAWVEGMRIPKLQHAAFGHEELRRRKLLLRRSQLESLRSRAEREQMTIVVTKCYLVRGRVKLEIALGRGKKKHDKRATIQRRDAEREARQSIKRGRDG